MGQMKVKMGIACNQMRGGGWMEAKTATRFEWLERRDSKMDCDTQCMFACVCCQECLSKDGISSYNLIILTLSEGHRGIMEVKYCIPLVF